MADDLDDVFDEGTDRRTFIRRIAIGAAFMVPAVSSFSMTGLTAANAFGGRSGDWKHVFNPNQTISNPNQTDDCGPIRNPNSSGPIKNPNSSGPIYNSNQTYDPRHRRNIFRLGNERRGL
jgi:hypothetical protein